MSVEVRSAVTVAVERRDHLLNNELWFSGDELTAPVSPRLTANELDLLRRQRKILSARFRNLYIYPAFQFEAFGNISPFVERLLAMMPPSDANWACMFWLFQNTGRLDGARPADL